MEYFISSVGECGYRKYKPSLVRKVLFVKNNPARYSFSVEAPLQLLHEYDLQGWFDAFTVNYFALPHAENLPIGDLCECSLGDEFAF